MKKINKACILIISIFISCAGVVQNDNNNNLFEEPDQNITDAESADMNKSEAVEDNAEIVTEKIEVEIPQENIVIELNSADDDAVIISEKKQSEPEKVLVKDEAPEIKKEQNQAKPLINEKAEKPVTEKKASAAIPADIELSKTEKLEFGIDDNIEIKLINLGWICINTDSLEFVKRSYISNETVFEFRAEKPGTFNLLFQFQDAENNRMEQQKVVLKVSDKKSAENNLPEKNENQTAVESIEDSKKLISHDFNSADELLDAVNNKDSELIELYVTNNENLCSELEFDDLVNASGVLADNDKIDSAVMVLEKGMEVYSDSSDMDWLYFLLGQYLEKNTPQRNVKKAMKYYGYILENYPYSSYYLDAEKRYKYINLHFFNIK